MLYFPPSCGQVPPVIYCFNSDLINLLKSYVFFVSQCLSNLKVVLSCDESGYKNLKLEKIFDKKKYNIGLLG